MCSASLLLTVLLLPVVWGWNVPEPAVNWLNKKGYSTSILLRELVLMRGSLNWAKASQALRVCSKHLYNYFSQ